MIKLKSLLKTEKTWSMTYHFTSKYKFQNFQKHQWIKRKSFNNLRIINFIERNPKVI